jgi:broad specificity phosphatase PhoE
LQIKIFRALAIVCLPLLFAWSSFAQTVSASSHTAKATAEVATSQALSVADAPYGLTDALVRELRNGGYVLYVRHGAVLPGTVDKIGAGEWWKDCLNTQRLGPLALAQMRAVAEALSRQRIAVNEVLSSEFCRAYDSAGLLGLAPPQRTSALNDISWQGNRPQLPAADAARLATYVAGISQLIARPIPPKTNRVLVGHSIATSLVDPALSSLPESYTAIFKVEAGNRFHFITTLSPGQWQWIGKQPIADFNLAASVQAPQVIAVAPATNIPLIDASKELKGAALLQALRKGGFNLYMRHGMANIGQDGNLIQTPRWWDNCAIQRNIADAGREQARKVGASLRELKIPVSQVVTAQFCRTRDTGHAIGLGPIEVTEDLNHQIAQRVGFDVNAARFKLLAEAPAKGTNRILVSHTHGSPKPQERIMSGMQEAEIVVFQPDSKGGSEPVARIPIAEWDNLLKADPAAKP